MKKIIKLALILSLVMLSFSFAKQGSNSGNSKNKSTVSITFKVEGFEDVVKQIDSGKKVNQINDFHKQAGDFAQFKGIVDEWCVVEPAAQKACYDLQGLWHGPKFSTDAVIVGKVKKTFDITFVNFDGSTIVTVPTLKGEIPVFPESEKAKLVREKTAKYSYTFKGWNPALVKATANATYKAVYDSTVNTFKVSFFVDGELFGDAQVVKYGKDAHYPKAKPAKEGYAFVGWDVAVWALKHVTKDIDVNAKFVKTYKVCFKGAELDKCSEVIENTVVPVAKLPVNLKTTCTAWTLDGKLFPHAFVKVTKDLNFEGVCHANFVKVRFLVDGEQYGKTHVIHYGAYAIPPKAPVKEGYRFVGWDKPFVHVFKDIDVNALFVKTFKVCYEGAGLKKCVVKDSSAFVKVPPTVSSKDSTCTAWTLDGSVVESKVLKVNGDMNFQGVCHANAYDVLFLVDGAVVDSQRVAHGTAATKPENPTKEGYRFEGWDVSDEVLGNVTKDIKANAKFVKTFKVCYKGGALDKCTEVKKDSVVFIEKLPIDKENTCIAWTVDGVVFPHLHVKVYKDFFFEGACHPNFVKVRFFVDGEQYGETHKVPYGGFAKAPKDPVKEGYRFIGWDKPFAHVFKDVDVNAKFVKTFNVCYEGAGLKKCVVKDSSAFVKVPPAVSSEDSTCTGWTVDGTVVEGKVVKVNGDIKFQGVCHANTHEVLFLVDGAVVDSQRVAHGTAATKPENPAKEGFRFEGWDVSDEVLGNVTKDIKANAQFVKTFKVCYKGGALDKCTEVKKDSVVFVEKVPKDSNYTCLAWKVDGIVFPHLHVKVYKDYNFEGVCHASFVNVRFFVDGEQYGDTHKVPYGLSAKTPKDPVKEGYRFIGWDKSFAHVFKDVDVNAKFVKTFNVCFEGAGAKKCDVVDSASFVKVPPSATSEDSTCTGWAFEGAAVEAKKIKVEGDMNIQGVCRANFHDVLFLVDESVVDSQRVAHGTAATKPEDPAKEGFIFAGWDAEFSNVESDLKINALFNEAATVCFNAKEVPACTTVVKGNEVNVPELPGSEGPDGFTCTGWTLDGAAFEAATVKADSNITVEAVCHDNANVVKFVAFDTVLVDSQRVEYGKAAKAPADSLVPEFPGFRFSDWDKDFSSVKSAMVVNAVFDTMFMVTVKAFKTNEEKPFIDTSIVAVKDTVLFNGISKFIMQVMEFSCDEVTVNGAAADFEKLVTSPFVVKGKTDVVATDCHDAFHKVQYFVNDSALGSEVVAHNAAALVKVNVPKLANKRFVGWDNAEELKHVVADLEVNAVYEDVDTVFVLVHGKAIDTIVVAKGKTEDYVLKAVEDSDDSVFVGWVVDKDKASAGSTIQVKGGMSIVAEFGTTTDAIHGKRVAAFDVRSMGGQLEVIGAKKGGMLTVLDLQGRVIFSKTVLNSVEMVQIATSGTYLVRVGSMSKMVTVR